MEDCSGNENDTRIGIVDGRRFYLVVHPTNRKWGPQPWLFSWDKWGQCPLITGVN